MKAGVKLLNLHQSFAVCFDYSDTTCVFVPNCAQNLLLMALRYLTDKSALVPPPPPPSRRQSRTGRCGRSGVLAAGPGAAAGPRAPPSPLPVALIARPGPAEPSVRRGCRPGRHGCRAGPPPGPAAGAAGGRRAAAGCRRLLQLEGQVGAGQVGAGQVGAHGPGVRLRAPPFSSGPGRGGSGGSGPGPVVAVGERRPRASAEPSPRGQRLAWSVPFGQGCCWNSLGVLRAIQPEVTPEGSKIAPAWCSACF